MLDAAGKDVVLIETVGVGQSEIEVASVVDVVVLVLQPGSGDSVQALKAGVMEIPDIICINKKDHPDAKAMRVRAAPRAVADAGRRCGRPWSRPTRASGEGVAELWAAVEERRAPLGPEGLEARRRASLERELRDRRRGARGRGHRAHAAASARPTWCGGSRRATSTRWPPSASCSRAAFEDARQSV